ncbi:hypothetical protein M513_08491 [Trichuris suis]|uniref:Uncharacterized protein n=1 Tax=Trichuris suis TaxID=68888 RepID=A0A085M0D8_9BILA|nr:hypothetical protein M513_08491 [Trichuris suis]
MSLAEHNVRWPEPNEGYPLTTFISHTQDTISTIQLYTEPYGRNVRVELICFVECQVELDNAVQSEKALTVRGVAMRMTEKLHLVHVTINVMEDIHSYVISEEVGCTIFTAPGVYEPHHLAEFQPGTCESRITIHKHVSCLHPYLPTSSRRVKRPASCTVHGDTATWIPFAWRRAIAERSSGINSFITDELMLVLPNMVSSWNREK